MAKGYVKAVVEQINQQKFGHADDEEDGGAGAGANKEAAAASATDAESGKDAGEAGKNAVGKDATGVGKNATAIGKNAAAVGKDAAGGTGKDGGMRKDGGVGKKEDTKHSTEKCGGSPRSPPASPAKPAIAPKKVRSDSVPNSSSPGKKVAENSAGQNKCSSSTSFHGELKSEGCPAKAKAGTASPPASPAKGEGKSPRSKEKPAVDFSKKPRSHSAKTEGSKPPVVTANGGTPARGCASASDVSDVASPVNYKERAPGSRKNSRAEAAPERMTSERKNSENGGVDANALGQPMSPAELFDSSWSESEFEDDLNESDLDEKLQQAAEKVEVEPVDETPKDRLTRIAEELLSTEKAYVARLRLLNEGFRSHLLKQNQSLNFMPTEVIKRMFSNLESIFNFHDKFILPVLEERMEKWESERRIGDLMKKFAPFLKLYTEYVKNFDSAMNLINHWKEKSSKFANIIHEVQKQPASGNLSLQHHMLEPIQRVPRYELMLKDYLKYLPEDSTDRTDAHEALELVTKAASHSNEAMKKIEKFRKLLEIHQSLRGISIDFISPTRELIREGSLTKISARSGEKQTRFLFLFNDLLVICSEPLLGAYRVKAHLDVDGMELKIGDNPNYSGTFCVMSRQKSIELLDENPATEPAGPTWIDTITKVIEDFRIKKMSLRAEEEKEQPSEMETSWIGTRAPRWIPDDMATVCMRCDAAFSTFRRRHHCRACGWVVCSKCCQKAPLAYMDNSMERVCSKCYNIIVHGTSAQASPASPTNKKGLLQVEADEAPVLSGYLSMSVDKGKSWMRRWFSVKENFVLYSFQSQTDKSALTSQPLPGYSVEPVKSGENVFKLHHKNMKKVFLFQADCDKEMFRWVNVLQCMVKLELPANQRHSTQSSSSTGSSGCGSSDSNSNSATPANTAEEVTPTGDQPRPASSSSASDPSPSNPESSDTSSPSNRCSSDTSPGNPESSDSSPSNPQVPDKGENSEANNSQNTSASEAT